MLPYLSVGTSELPPLFAEAVDCALAAGLTDRVEQLLAACDQLKPAELIPLLEAEVTRARARVAAHKGERDAAERHFRWAIDLLGELESEFYLARAQLEYAELLVQAAHNETEAAELRDEAEAVFRRLGAMPWLQRATELGSAVAV
jgi:uncharacterized small protein (DUF1192 family)